MYSLRTINTVTGQESNIALGISFILLKYEEYNADESAFNNHVCVKTNHTGSGNNYLPKEMLKNYVLDTKHYATIIGDGVSIDLFYGDNAYYVMINGNTYANVTKK